MKVEIRRATIEDAERLLIHTKEVITQTNYLLTTPNEFSMTLDQEVEWIKTHQEPGHLLLIAEVEGRMVGLLNFSQKQRKRISHIGFFGVSILDSYCNLGIGRKMIEYLLEWAKKEPGIEKVCLEVFSHNTRAIHLYQKLGFKEEGRKIKFIKFEDGSYVDELLMYQFVK